MRGNPRKVSGRKVAGRKETSVVLAAILVNNRNIVGTGMDGLLSTDIGFNLVKLLAVRAMVTEGRDRALKISGDREAWSETGDISQVGNTPKVIGINYDAKIIDDIGKREKIREILEDLSLLYEFWG